MAHDVIEVLELPGGRRMTIRSTSRADADHFAELYGSLTDTDLYRRFFSAYRPTDEWCADWAGVGERGGAGVIALVHDDADEPAAGSADVDVAGEAGYALRDDGDGDLAISVAPSWRHWLGAFLLDVLARRAHDHGIANLQADVLSVNSPMLALLRGRGAISYEHDDGAKRMSIATSGNVASWPPLDRRPHVLVEVAGGRWAHERAATDAGLAVAECTGPRRRHRTGCPVLRGDRCPLADQADAIVVALDADDDETVELVRRHAANAPDTPIYVRSPRRSDRRFVLPPNAHEIDDDIVGQVSCALEHLPT